MHILCVHNLYISVVPRIVSTIQMYMYVYVYMDCRGGMCEYLCVRLVVVLYATIRT